MTRSLLTLKDLSSKDLFAIFERAKQLKADIKQRKEITNLRNKVVGILFEKPSTRTRASFEVATLRLGGQALYLSSNELQLKRGEPVKDTARILGSYLDILVARVYNHQTVEELAQYTGIPVINGLSDFTHPTQAVCDLFTVLEVKHTFCQSMAIYFISALATPALTDLIILAVDTPHIAVAEEYCPRPTTSRNNRLLATVSTNTGDDRQTSRMAKPTLPLQTVDATFTRTNITPGQPRL